MKSNFIFLIFLGLCSVALFGQEELIIIDPNGEEIKFMAVKKKSDSLKSEKAPKPQTLNFGSDDLLLKQVLNNEFARLVTGNSFAGLGNYAAISTKDNTFSASLNFIKDKGVFGVKVFGGASDNAANLFSNFKLNTSAGVGIAYHFLLPNNSISIRASDLSDIKVAEDRIKAKYKAEEIKAEGFRYFQGKAIAAKNKELKALRNSIAMNKRDPKKAIELEANMELILAEIEILSSKKRYYAQQKNIDQIINKLRNNRDDPANKSPFKEETFGLDSLKAIQLPRSVNNELKIKNQVLAKIKAQIKANNPDTNIASRLREQLNVLKNDSLQLGEKLAFSIENENEIISRIPNTAVREIRANRKKINDIKATDIQVSWITLAAEAKRNINTLFDGSRPIAMQIFSKEDVSKSFTLAYSKYMNVSDNNSLSIGARKVGFFSLGINGTIGNNISGLELLEIRTVDSLSPGRTLIRTQDAYVGEYRKDILSAMAFVDYYQFIGNKDNVGFHIRGTLNLGEFKPVSSFRAGFLFPFTKQENQKSIVNLEIFLGLNDIFKKAKEESFLRRNVLGIQATVPLNFKIL